MLNLNTQDYNKGKKHVIVVNSGYEPVKVKLGKRFNPSVFWNLLYPLNFLYDHYTVLSEKKVNNFSLKKESTISCFEYYEMALNSKKDKEKIQYFQKAIEQDYRNENGIKANALNHIGMIYTQLEETHLAYLYFNKAIKVNPACGAKDNLIQLKDIVNNQNKIAEYKKQKRENTIAILGAIGSGLYEIGSSLEQISTNTSGGSTSSNSGNSTSKTTTTSNNKAKADCGQDWITDSKTYSNYESLLVQMRTYPERYSNYTSDYTDIQSKMRQIRQKWESRGCLISKSPYE